MFSETEFTFNSTRSPTAILCCGKLERRRREDRAPGGFGIWSGRLGRAGRQTAHHRAARPCQRNGAQAGRAERHAVGLRRLHDQHAGDQRRKGCRCADVWLGEQESVPLVATETFQTGLHVDALKGIKGEVVYKSPLIAPVKEGDIVGELIITAPGVGATRIPVAAGAAVNQLGIFGKAMAGCGDGRKRREDSFARARSLHHTRRGRRRRQVYACCGTDDAAWRRGLKSCVRASPVDRRALKL